MSMRDIRADLEGRLKTWADAQVPPIKVAFEGTPFVKPSTSATRKTWLQCWIMPAQTQTVTVSADRHREIGIFQITVYGEDGKGTREVDELAEQLIDLFPVYPKFSETSIESRGFTSEHDIDDGFRKVHVRFFYRREISSL